MRAPKKNIALTKSRKFMGLIVLMFCLTASIRCGGTAVPDHLLLSISIDSQVTNSGDTKRLVIEMRATPVAGVTDTIGVIQKESLVNQGDDLVTAPYTVEIIGEQLTGKVQARIRAMNGNSLIAVYGGEFDLEERKVINVLLLSPNSSCDEDGDGTLNCAIEGCCDDLSIPDCEDSMADVNVFAADEDPCEPCANEIDENCDGVDVACIDEDQDGSLSGCGDCNDQDPNVGGDFAELCDGLDNNCNQQTDEGFSYSEVDGSASRELGETCGLGLCAGGIVQCSQDGTNSVVCADNEGLGGQDKATTEACGDGEDNDCDGSIDEGCLSEDQDGDGYVDAEDCSLYENAKYHPEINPGVTEEPCCMPIYFDDPTQHWRCDWDCNETIVSCAAIEDTDGDGILDDYDCEDDDPNSHQAGVTEMGYEIDSAPVNCLDDIIQDCSEDAACKSAYTDEDGDGYIKGNGDCDDNNENIKPGVAELCDGIDNDCDGLTDEGNPDTGGEWNSTSYESEAPCHPYLSDIEVVGKCQAGIKVCMHQPGKETFVACINYIMPQLRDEVDCEDPLIWDTSASPAISDLDSCRYESCDEGELDLDCDGDNNDLDAEASPIGLECTKFYRDQDGDNFGHETDFECRCREQGEYNTTNHTDCNDEEAYIKPRPEELACDAIDEDCDGLTDEDTSDPGNLSDPEIDACVVYYFDGDEDGFGSILDENGICACASFDEYTSLVNDDCNDDVSTTNPDVFDGNGVINTGCNNVDDNCDGSTDESFNDSYFDTFSSDTFKNRSHGEGCGVGACAGGVVSCNAELDQLVCSTDPSNKSTEVCDSIDNDCDGLTDANDANADPLVQVECAIQQGVCSGSMSPPMLCINGSWTVCNHTVYSNHNSNYEISVETKCDNLDNDCDGSIDEAADLAKPSDSCGLGECAHEIDNCVNGATITCNPFEGSIPELCDNLDNDCDGTTDNGFPNTDGTGLADCLDNDDDNDGLADAVDSCPQGETGWLSNGSTDYDNDGCRDNSPEDLDDDNDNVLDTADACAKGQKGWTSTSITDYDSDGCKDNTAEDTDDDNDGINDSSDLCAKGFMPWTSNAVNDHDSDGCLDAIAEDNDDDNDGRNDGVDACPKGQTGWVSTSGTDYDSDGCKDNTTEDIDDDNDGRIDSQDSCSKGSLGWSSNGSTDHDSDGCRDSDEDLDDDNDSVADIADSCAKGSLGWTSNGSTDHDSDGCQDSQVEDLDDDNDGKPDSIDSCSKGDIGWTSTSGTDLDQDGCRDSTEDTDDDGDGVSDSSDACPQGVTSWTSNSAFDHDSDGCLDANAEDPDDDNDGLIDTLDSCDKGFLGWTSNASNDHDSDGCKDNQPEDPDDDNDSLNDGSDSCPKGVLGWTSNNSTDHDSDGCKDNTAEDNDDDNDGVSDGSDDCAKGELGWLSNGATDFDSDGCRDSSEDTDDDNDGDADVTDCADTNPAINASATEICDGINNNCANGIDEGFQFGGVNIGGTCSANTDPCLIGIVACNGTASTQCSNNPANPEASGTICQAQSCSGSTLFFADTCNGSGSCINNGTAPCPGGHNCDIANVECLTGCFNNDDCQTNHYCGTGDCLPKKSNGQTCSSGDVCTSGSCVDGVCCNTGCGSECTACNLPGSLGTCSFISDGQDPSAECGGCELCNGAGACRTYTAGDGDKDKKAFCADQGTTCGQTGECQVGANSCAVASPTTECGATSCNGAGSTFGEVTPTCDGAGSCSSESTADCNGYRCDQFLAGCLTSCIGPNTTGNLGLYCDESNHCGNCQTTGTSCSGNTCQPDINQLSTDVLGVTNSKCVGCHSGTGAWDFDTMVGKIGVIPGKCDGLVLVTPGDLSNSCLWTLIEASVMPQGGSLTNSQRNKIRRWILEGAKDN